jgi:hypothetical protein
VTIKYTTAPSCKHSNSHKTEGAVTDSFEQTWDRYLRALEDMRRLSRERRDKITTIMENLNADCRDGG